MRDSSTEVIFVHYVTVIGFISMRKPIDIDSFRVKLNGFELSDHGSFFDVEDELDEDIVGIRFVAQGMLISEKAGWTPGAVAQEIECTVPILEINRIEHQTTDYTTLTGSYCICPSGDIDPIYVNAGGVVYG